MKKNNKGITLIALVITVIILLILAGLSISALTGSGLFKKAGDAKELSIIGEEKEEITVALAGIAIGKKGDTSVTAEELETELKNNTKKNIKVTGKGILEVLYVDTEHCYKVDGNGNIEETVVIPEVTDKTPGELEGEGTESNPYKVSSIEDLVAMSQTVETGEKYEGKYFDLTIDLDFKSTKSYVDSERTDMGDVNKDGKTESLIQELTTGRGFIPIGCDIKKDDVYHYFDGIFDGKDHSIYNLYIRVLENDEIVGNGRGLFGLSENGITVKNLNMKSVDIKAENDCEEFEIGAILGAAWDDVSTVIIENCTVDGEIKVNGIRIGGLVGSAWGNLHISNCKNYAKIDGADSIGGIIGESGTKYAIIENCENHGNIMTNGDFVGGICGDEACEDGYITNCKNYGDIKSAVDFRTVCIGGIFGYASGKISECYNFGNINVRGNSEEIGGIVGEYCKYATSAMIENCYNKGNIIADNCSCVGGVIGRTLEREDTTIKNEIYNCFNNGEVKGKNYVGGCVGMLGNYRDYGTYTKISKLKNCYNIGKIEGEMCVGGVVGQNGFKYTDTKYNKTIIIYGDIENCYNVGNVIGNTNIGGIVGLLNKNLGATITNSYYLSTTCDKAYTTETEATSNEEGRTIAEMTASSFIDLLNTGNTERIWEADTKNINNKYPILNWQK